MPVVEFNDVDIAPLFSWSKEFEIVSDTEEPRKVYMRVLGDADMGKARVSALRASAELRRKLKDLGSDERLAFIKDPDDIDKDTMIAVIIVLTMRGLSEIAKTKLKIKLPKQPRTDAKTSVQEKYQQEVDSYPERRQKELKSLLDKEVIIAKTALEAEDNSVLYSKYVSAMIDEMCEQEQLRAFKSWSCYLGSYRDAELRERLFSSFEDFNNLEPNLKQQFIAEYGTLELYGDDLKKLQRVMP